MYNPLNANPNMNKDVTSIQGIYRGVVEDNNDPLNICRLRVRVPYLNGAPGTSAETPTEGLPWAAACIPYAGPGYGEVLIPEVGSTVWVIFENNQKDKPVWIGCSYGAASRDGFRKLKSVGYHTFESSNGEWTYGVNMEDTPFEFVERNKDVKVLIRTPKGFSILIDEKDGAESLEITDRIGQVIQMFCPTMVSSNQNNRAVRTIGNVADGNINDGVYSEADLSRSFILLQAQGEDNTSSTVKLSNKRAFISNNSCSAEMLDKQLTVTNGPVRVIVDDNQLTATNDNVQIGLDDKMAYIVTEKSRLGIEEDETYLTHGRSQVILRDNEVEMDNGNVGIRLGGSIELNGPVVLPSHTHGMGSIEGDIDANKPSPYVPSQ